MHRILARLPNFRRSRRGDSEVPRCDPRLHGRTAIALLLWGAHGSERYRRWMQTFVRIPGDRPFALRRAGHPDEPQRDDADEAEVMLETPVCLDPGEAGERRLQTHAVSHAADHSFLRARFR